MKIIVFPRKYFLDIKGSPFEKELFRSNNIISIITPPHPPTNFPDEGVPFSECYKNLGTVCVLKFHDANVQSDDSVVLFNHDDAKRIWEFVQQTKQNGKNYIVHCTAGLSRSQAVGYVLNEYFNGKLSSSPNPIDYKEYERCYANCRRMNSLVKKLLLEQFFG